MEPVTGILMAIDLAVGLYSRANQYMAAVAKARAEGRDITDEELAAAGRADDEEAARQVLKNAQARAEGR